MSIRENAPPQTTGIYRDASQRSKITRVLLLAFLIRAFAMLDAHKLKDNPGSEFHHAVNNLNLIAWAILWATLMIAADYDTTTNIALAFAILMLVVVLANDGLAVFDNLQQFAQWQNINTPYNPAPKSKGSEK